MDSSSRDRSESRAHVQRVVARSKTSFVWGMRMLPAERRRAMYAIYAFCREVDDVADEPAATAVKRNQLAAWRDEVARLYAGRPQSPTGRALLEPVRRFALPREEFLTVIEGVEIDTAPVVRMQTLDDLLSYCRKVAGAVGMLSIHAFGVPGHPGPQLAETLGNAVQLTNILRDLKEDASLQRLYLPLDLLAGHGIAAEPMHGVFAHPQFASVCAELASLARRHFGDAQKLIKELETRRIQPAAVMMAVYRETLERLEERGWQRFDGPIRLTGARKLWLALRHGLL